VVQLHGLSVPSGRWVIPTIGPVSRKTADYVVLAVVLDLVAGHRGMTIPGRPISVSRIVARFADFSIESRHLVEKNSIERLIECQADNAAYAEKGAYDREKRLVFSREPRYHA
jgi:hypothetical protein